MTSDLFPELPPVQRSALRRGALVLLLPLVLGATPAVSQTHPSELLPLTPDAQFPRCTQRELMRVGFPDHLHAHQWSDWEPLRGPDGRAFGPGAFCYQRTVEPQAGLIIEPDSKQYGPFVFQHNPGYGDCDMLGWLELLVWAGTLVPELLDLEAPGTLVVVNPDNTKQYREMTGQGTWRLYQLQGDDCVIEPYPVLQARTLEAHAAFMLVTEWTLRTAIEQDLPPWLLQGLVEYIAEDGVHLINYMNEFRPNGPILMSPPLVDALLTRGVDPDPGRDREMYRRACYSAYLMAWQLVENEGGLEALREFLALAADGAALDDASRRVYGLDMAGLAELLDPVILGEPVGKSTQSRTPDIQP